MKRRTAPASAALVALAAATSFAQFTPIVTDFSAGVQPFTSGATLDTATYVSGPSSMRIAHQYVAKSLESAAGAGAYNGTVVQANFWTGPGFPASPTRFYCMLRDLTLGAAGHEMDIHLNFGSTDYGYSWLGMHYLKQGASSSGWEIGMDETIDDIGSLRNPWAGQPTFREKYDQLYGTRERKPAVVLTLVIETAKGAICIDDLSVAMQATPVKQPPQLTVRPAGQAAAGAWRVVTANGRVLGAQTERPAAVNYVARFAQGYAPGAVVGR